jgi:hypothetical protein
MLKGYKVLPKVTDAKVVEDFKKDMEASNANAAWEAQMKEFSVYLQEKLDKQPNNEFFQSMAKRLMFGTLTENMVNAIRKCMERDNAPKEAKQQPVSAQRTITLKIKPWLMKGMGIDSRVITGIVKAESAKAYLIEGHADMIQNACWCMRCGRELTEPASQVTGFGEWCAAEVGVAYRGDILTASAKERKAIRMEFVEKLHNQKFERWIPKSQVSEVVLEPTEKLTKVKAPQKSASEARTAVARKREKKTVAVMPSTTKKKATSKVAAKPAPKPKKAAPKKKTS